MGVETSGWIGFGVKLKVGDMPAKYDNWSVEEAIMDVLYEDIPSTDTGHCPISFCESGYHNYGGRGEYFIVAKTSYQGIGFQVRKLDCIDTEFDVELNKELDLALEKLSKHEWIKVEGERTWMGALYMH